MNIFTPDFTPPKELTTKDFCIFPTDDAFFESDFVAVMNNRELLRIWSQSTWPEDDFTPIQNKEDLNQHIDDNRTHAAYGYMIYSLDKQICYGSVYVNPLVSIPNNYQTTEAENAILKSHHARIDCWIIQEIPEIEKIILIELKKWFDSVWKIRPLFSARLGLNKRIALYEELEWGRKVNAKSKTSDMTVLLF